MTAKINGKRLLHAIEEEKQEKPFKQEIVWRNVAVMGTLHLISFYALVTLYKADFRTILWGKFLLFGSL